MNVIGTKKTEDEGKKKKKEKGRRKRRLRKRKEVREKNNKKKAEGKQNEEKNAYFLMHLFRSVVYTVMSMSTARLYRID